MTRTKRLATIIGVVFMLMTLLACGEAAVPSPANQQLLPGAQPVAAADLGSTSLASPAAATQSGLPSVQIGMGQTGVSVTGEGSITLVPDLALLNIGVETTANTVAEARQQAAAAMDAVVSVLHSRGIDDKDFQTQRLNIWSRYEWREEVTETGFHTGKEVLVGYSVGNSATVKIRDLEAVGEIIDEVAGAGGDHIRINGLSFVVEDPKPFLEKLQEDAISDARSKAQRFAGLSDVQLGRLVFLSDSAGSLPGVFNGAFAGKAAELSYAAAPGPATPINQGQLELRMTVQAVFDIQ